jgi:hypothetical protein
MLITSIDGVLLMLTAITSIALTLWAKPISGCELHLFNVNFKKRVLGTGHHCAVSVHAGKSKVVIGTIVLTSWEKL